MIFVCQFDDFLLKFNEVPCMIKDKSCINLTLWPLAGAIWPNLDGRPSPLRFCPKLGFLSFLSFLEV